MSLARNCKWVGPLSSIHSHNKLHVCQLTEHFFSRWFLHFQHVDPTEAVCIHEDIQSHHSLGIHWGTFPTGYEVLNGSQK